MPRAYSYIRWSHPTQTEGDSLRRQWAASEAYAAERGMTLDGSHRDEGRSGYHGRHLSKSGALRTFLDGVESGAIPKGSYLIIENLDRLSRLEALNGFQLFSDLVRAGIVIVTLMDRIVYSRQTLEENSTILLIALMHIIRARQESSLKADRVREAHGRSKREAREQGRRWTKAGPSWTIFDSETGRHIERPERADAVRRAWELALAGQSFKSVCAILQSEDRPAPTRHGWTRNTLSGLFAARTVFGEYQPTTFDAETKKQIPDGAPIPGYYPETIPEADFHRLRAVLKMGKARGLKSEAKVGNLLQGLTRCADCGGVMGVHINVATKDGRNAALRCNTAFSGRAAVNGKPCPNTSRVNYARFEATLLRDFAELEIDDSHTTAVARVQERAEKLTSQVNKLGGHLAEKDDRRLRERYDRTVQDLDRAEKELADLERNGLDRTPAEARARALEIIAKLPTLQGTALYHARQRLSIALRTVITIAIVHPKGKRFSSLRKREIDLGGLIEISVRDGMKLYYYREGESLGSLDFSPRPQRRGLIEGGH